jgi:hypothetical protein
MTTRGTFFSPCSYRPIHRQAHWLRDDGNAASTGSSVDTFKTTNPYCPIRQFNHAQEAAHLQSFHAYSLVREDGRVAMDLHWTVMPSYFAVSLDPKGLWECLEPIDLVGTAVLGLPLEDVLLFLCIHGFKHGWERLGWICDGAELLRVHQRMDWGGVLEQTQASGSLRILLLGLLLASDLLGVALPEGIAQRLETDPSVNRLGAQVRAQLSMRLTAHRRSLKGSCSASGGGSACVTNSATVSIY